MRRSCLTIAPLLVAVALSACNRASDALQPAPTAQATAQPAPGSPAAAPAQAGAPANPMTGAAVPAAAGITTPAPTPAQAAAILGKARLQIAPIVGTSVEAATPLTQRLAARAKESGITLAGSAGQGATHVLKGYFSTISEGKDTTVIYVWDVYDPAGTRLHRINGQQKAPTVSGAEGWAAVPPATMQAIADQTITQLTNWLAGRPAG
ncbi:MAG: hypothetical protein IKE42_04845 [Aquamicrobium sp.]|uniref:hypothetical protein n=1 Tax=Mesorhizobium sp. Pch-S TaxID=2082387 RepID=UPI001013018F|nr:hypothetical protein [Mesorhizobium sp. Pch-S]MBR2687156.1 hypothetical protein [Aquamicrobium sp.]QAZ44902.1 hypothetical protein C1M53_20120 [Mesorhizobium sp. Pch-S]